MKQVVLPEPLGPMSPRISPGFTSKETLLSAVKPPKRLIRPLTPSTEGRRPGAAAVRRYRAANGDEAGSGRIGLPEAMTLGQTCLNWPSMTW